MSKFYLTEKRNHNVIHAIFDSQENALRHLKDVIPEYCNRGYFMDKTLVPEDFEVVSRPWRLLAKAMGTHSTGARVL